MIGSQKIAVLGALVIMGMAALPAHATFSNTEVLIIDAATGPSGVLFTCSSVGASCAPDDSTFSISYKDADFNLTSSGVTTFGNSPDGPASLTLNVSTQSLTGSAGTPNNLTVEVSEIGFLQPVGGSYLEFSATQIGTGNTNHLGSSSAQGFVQTGSPATYFCASTASCTASTPLLSFANLGPSFSSSSTSTTTLGPTFSVEEVVTQSFKGATTVGQNASTDVALSAVLPEPASVLLFGTVVLFAAKSIRRKTQKA